MSIFHFPAPPLTPGWHLDQYHRPKPKPLEVAPYGRDVRFVGCSSTLPPPIPHPRSPSPRSGCSCFPFQIMHNSRMRHDAATHAPPPLSEKPELKEAIFNISKQEEMKCTRTISGRRVLVNVNDADTKSWKETFSSPFACVPSDVATAHREIIMQRSPSPAFPKPRSNPNLDTANQTRNARAAAVNSNKMTLASTPSDRVRFGYLGRRTKHATIQVPIGHEFKFNRIPALPSSRSCSPARLVFSIGPSRSSSSMSDSKSKDPVPSPQTTSSCLHYEPREGPVLRATIPSLSSTPTPPALLQRYRQEQQALVVAARSEKRHKHLPTNSMAGARSGEFKPPRRRWEAEDKMGTRRNSLEQGTEREEMIGRTASTQVQAQTQHTPTLIPELSAQVERKKPHKLLKRHRSSPSIPRVAANTERPSSLAVVENNTIQFAKSHGASKSWGGIGKERLDTTMATSPVERREDRDAPNFVMTAARRSLTARPVTTSMPADVECGRRKEHGWSGGWNREDMDEVVTALRSLKAE